MKKYKVYIKGNYLHLQEIDSGELFSGLKKEVFIDKNNIGLKNYRFFNVKDWEHENALTIEQLFKENGVAYTEIEFDDFYLNNSGLSAVPLTTQVIQDLRPLKTVGGESLEGAGNILVPKIIVKSTNIMPPVTGTTSVVTVASALIPANTVNVGDIIRIKARVSRVVPTSANTSISISVSPIQNDSVSNLLGSGKKFTGDVMTSTNTVVQVEHDLFVNSATSTRAINSTVFSDNVQSLSIASNNVNWAVVQYLYILLGNANTTTQSILEGYSIEKI